MIPGPLKTLYIILRFVLTNHHMYIASSEDCYRSNRLLQMLLVCYSLVNSQNISINNSEKGWLIGHLECSYESSRSCTEKGAITGPC